MSMEQIKKDEKSGLMYRVWAHPDPDAVFVLVHGLGAHSARWDFLGEFCVKSNIASYAIELRGFGETLGVRGHVQSFSVYFVDIIELITLARHEHPGKKVFLVGESMGGLIAFIMASIVPSVCNGVVCVSPAFKGAMKFPLYTYIALTLSYLFYRSRKFRMPFASDMLTRDGAYRTALDSDMREHRYATPQMLANIIIQQRLAKKIAREITMPVLFQVAGRDRLVDTGVTRNIFDTLGSVDKTCIGYPEMYHALSIDRGRKNVFADMCAWVKARV